MLVPLALLVVVVAQVPVPPSGDPTLTSLRARLYAYEQWTAENGRPDPAALAGLANAVIAQARRSPTFSVWSEACASTMVPESDDCKTRLWGVLNATRQPLTMRAEAASALMTRGDAAAAPALAGLLESVPLSSLVQFVPIVANMPAPLAVPLLLRLAGSSAPGDQEKACQALSAFDVPESHAAVAKIVDASPPGTPPWLFCMIARARLHEAVPAAAIGGYGNTLQGHGQLFAAQVMLELGNDAGTKLFEDLTHRGSIRDRLDAAEPLVSVKQDAAIPVIEAAQTNPDPEIRARSLAAERRLKRPPSKAVRAMLVDEDGTVRVRAAEAVLAWVKNSQNR